MDRGIITISDTGAVFMPAIPVWMTQPEIADLFGVYCSDIRRAVRSIYKNRESVEQDTMWYIKNDDRTSMDVYSLEMVINIAFRLRSRESLYFRQHLMRVLHPDNKNTDCLLLYMTRRKERTVFS
ncbi:hypothetical protein [Bacteroides ovatus]|jgi:hypothetical protein|uniref:hypothetical protein n=1 Tax=Bacteroides ovatus TaxID=28116 RepID=UPI00319DEF84